MIVVGSGRSAVSCFRDGPFLRPAPPNPPCALPRNGLSPSSGGSPGRFLRAAGLWRGDPGAPVAVADDRDRGRVGHRHGALRGPPPWQVAAAQLLPVDPRVLSTQPIDHPPPGERA